MYTIAVMLSALERSLQNWIYWYMY